MTFKPKLVKFDLYSDEELIKFCSLEVTETYSLDNLGHSIPNGLYDERMGPLKQGSTCLTCNQNYYQCPGHFGYIKTEEYIKPIVIDHVLFALQSKCFNCNKYKVMLSQENDDKFINSNDESEESEVKEINSKNFIINRNGNDDKFNNIDINALIESSNNLDYSALKTLRTILKIAKCPNCLVPHKPIHKVGNEIFSKSIKITIETIKSVLGANFNLCFSKIVLVTPNKFRPINYLGNKVYEDPMNNVYSKIIKERQPNLMHEVDLAIKQVIEKKEGIFRQNILGKRVNYSARSVISPDPNLATGEIGLPLIFAKKLSFPEKFTEFNFDRLFNAVINGNKYPGATHLTSDDVKIDLSFLDEHKRRGLAYQLKIGNKTVHRHVSNVDWLLVNRQPSLHKPSLMAHKVRVLGGEKTIRMHYANCNSYNADFDGDEINLHLVQDYLAFSEAKNILSTDMNYKSDTNNKPIRGLVQDHIVGATLLTMKDTFLTPQEFFYLTISHNVKSGTILPAIIRPCKLYSGKQCVSHLIHSIDTKVCLNNKSKVDEEEVVIMNSHLLSGVLDKNNLGPTSKSLVEIIGNKNNSYNTVLTLFSSLINKYLLKYGFTLRINDLFLNDCGEKVRKKEIYAANKEIENEFMPKQNTNICSDYSIKRIKKQNNNKKTNFTQKHFHLTNKLNYSEEAYHNSSYKIKNIMNQFTSKVLNHSLANTLIPFPYNNLSLIVLSGAKGSLVNVTQICCLLGQQELEGQRVSLMKNNLTLQILHQSKNTLKKENNFGEKEVEKGGFIFGRFLTGIKIHSFFFHCMAGREGLIDTAVKTARSGYLQRCLVKHLEGLMVCHNGYIYNNYNKIISFFSKKESGTPVGLIAAQSVGEPSTQMTLNTFHLAGVGNKNVTLGIPRLREILLVNKTNKKYFTLKQFDLKEIHSMLKDVLLRIKIKEKVKRKKLSDELVKEIIVRIKVSDHVKRVKEVLSDHFVIALNKILRKTHFGEKIIQNKISKEKEINLVENEEQNEEINEIISKESDSDTEKSENHELIKNDSLSNDNEDRNEESDVLIDNVIKKSVSSKCNVNSFMISSKKNIIKLSIILLEKKDVLLYPFIIEVIESMKLNDTEMNVIKDNNTITVEGCGINNLLTFMNDNLMKEVKDDYSMINLINLFITSYSNDIHSINDTLGLEASRNVIIKELKNVFDCYGISIDISHLELIGDYMCKTGIINAFSRNSFSNDDCMIQRMSFESTYAVLKNALMKTIHINGPSSKQMVGGLIKDECEIIYDLEN
ncbi:hypothetical protein H312_01288 [Anncaliia algerae PRA339]|uniref:DNA-directed RNA polymerase subunit n=1 Tax=Anncaliia algerae PRA339 TaxID=1288291 RepID=A0A059F2F3_9MICR|nr:hypothetical protein H312_01288 [Anncaliia algerae PRA339]